MSLLFVRFFHLADNRKMGKRLERAMISTSAALETIRTVHIPSHLLFTLSVGKF